MELLVTAAIIAVLYIIVRSLFGSTPMFDKLVMIVVAALVIAWLLCFLGVWCARGGVR
jgi:amino acid transporter